MGEDVRNDGATEEVVVRGHIIDSLLLPKILDRILQMGGTFEIRECTIGARRVDPSFARIAVRADSHALVEEIVGDLIEHGASPVHPDDATVEPADIPGAFPDGFYSTTNQRTQIRLGGRWVDVADQEMDCGIVVAADRRSARCVPMWIAHAVQDGRQGDRHAAGHLVDVHDTPARGVVGSERGGWRGGELPVEPMLRPG